MNNYYEVSLKELCVLEIERSALVSPAEHTAVRGEIANKDLVM